MGRRALSQLAVIVLAWRVASLEHLPKRRGRYRAALIAREAASSRTTRSGGHHRFPHRVFRETDSKFSCCRPRFFSSKIIPSFICKTKENILLKNSSQLLGYIYTHIYVEGPESRRTDNSQRRLYCNKWATRLVHMEIGLKFEYCNQCHGNRHYCITL